MIIYIDIDETICESPKDRDYSLSVPIEENIEKANKLYDEGDTIVYWTARGTVSGVNWEETTSKRISCQLKMERSLFCEGSCLIRVVFPIQKLSNIIGISETHFQRSTLRAHS